MSIFASVPKAGLFPCGSHVAPLVVTIVGRPLLIPSWDWWRDLRQTQPKRRPAEFHDVIMIMMLLLMMLLLMMMMVDVVVVVDHDVDVVAVVDDDG